MRMNDDLEVEAKLMKLGIKFCRLKSSSNLIIIGKNQLQQQRVTMPNIKQLVFEIATSIKQANALIDKLANFSVVLPNEEQYLDDVKEMIKGLDKFIFRGRRLLESLAYKKQRKKEERKRRIIPEVIPVEEI